MKTLFFLFVSFFVTINTIFSQTDYTIVRGEEKKIQINRMMTEVYNFSNDQFFCDKFLPDLEIISFESLSISNKQKISTKNDIEFIAYMKNKFQIIYSSGKYKKEYKLYCQTMTINNYGVTESNQIQSFDQSAKIKNEFHFTSFSVSDDKSKLAILYTRSNTKSQTVIHTTIVYDNEMNLLWEKSTTYDNKESDFSFFEPADFIVGNSGQTCNVWTHGSIEMLEFIDETGEFTVNYKLSEKLYDHSEWYELKIEGNKFLISCLSFNKKTGQHGLFFSEVNISNGELISSAHIKLLNSFDDFRFSLKKLHVLDDGKIFLIAENWDGHYAKTDLLVLLLDQNRQLIWSERIKKNQMPLVTDTHMTSFFSAIKNNELFLFFTDHPANIDLTKTGSPKIVTPRTKTNVSLVRITTDKEIHKENIYENGSRLNKSLCFQEKSNSPILINVRKGFKYRFDKID